MRRGGGCGCMNGGSSCQREMSGGSCQREMSGGSCGNSLSSSGYMLNGNGGGDYGGTANPIPYSAYNWGN